MVYGINSDKATAKFIPNNEIWIDSHIDLFELKFILFHELYERYLMKNTALEYDDAHNKANKS